MFIVLFLLVLVEESLFLVEESLSARKQVVEALAFLHDDPAAGLHFVDIAVQGEYEVTCRVDARDSLLDRHPMKVERVRPVGPHRVIRLISRAVRLAIPSVKGGTVLLRQKQ